MAVSLRAIEASAPFGIDATAQTQPVALQHEVPGVLRRLAPGRVALITGPSGAGKSTLVRALCNTVGSLTTEDASFGTPCVITPDDRGDAGSRDGSVIDAISGRLDDATGLLARAGLAEARLFAASPATLSEGERFRFRLALAMQRGLAQQGSWLIVDEFASVLDRLSARSLCSTLVRWVRRVGCKAGLRLVVASAHEDLASMLGADVVVRADVSGVRVESPPARASPRITIEAGTIEDYDRLAPLHYRAGRPATRPIIRRAMIEHAGTAHLAGVMVVSMPTLNGAWRDLSWPGRFTSGDKRARALRINRELRCISRVIVDTPCRGLSIGRMLVEDYLRDPATLCTESLAAMGAACPFFERAGMTAHELPESERDQRWREALCERGRTPAQALVAVRRSGDLDDVGADEDRAVVGGLAPEARRWCKASPGTRRGLGDLDAASIVSRAAMGLLARPVAYAHEVGG